jgi:predicted transcriptional regulator
MPAVSFYLSADVLARLQAEAKARKRSVSSVISEAVGKYLHVAEQSDAKTEFIGLLKKCGLGNWEEVYAERKRAEIDRS